MKKSIVWILIYIPSIVFCLLSFLLSIENDHYLFPNPGMNSDGTLIITILSALSFLSSSISLIISLVVWHRERTDFLMLIPCIINTIAVFRLIQVIMAYQKYE